MKKKQFMKAMAVAIAITLAVPSVSANPFVMQVEAAYSANDYEKLLSETDALANEVLEAKELADQLKAEAIADPAKAPENYTLLSAEWDKAFAKVSSYYSKVYDAGYGLDGKAVNYPNNDKKNGTIEIVVPELKSASATEALYADYTAAKEAYELNPSKENLNAIAYILADYATRESSFFDFVGETEKFYKDGLLIVVGKNQIGNDDRRGFEITGTSLNSLNCKMYPDLFAKDGTDYTYTIGEDFVHNSRTNATYELTKRPVFSGNTKVHVEFKDGFFSKSIDMKAVSYSTSSLKDMTAAKFESEEAKLFNQIAYNKSVYNYELANMYFSMLHNDFVEVGKIRNEYNEVALPDSANAEVAKAKAACESHPTEDNFVELAKVMAKSMCYENNAIDFSTIDVVSVNKEFDTICLVYQMKTSSSKGSYPVTKFYRYSTDLNHLGLTEVQVQYASRDGKVHYVLGGTKVYANKGKNAHNLVSASLNADQSVSITYKEFLSTKKTVVYPVVENTYVFSRVNTYQTSYKFPESCTHVDPVNDGKVLVFLNGTSLCTYLDEYGKSADFKSDAVEKSTAKNDVKKFTYTEGRIKYTVNATALFHSSTPSVYTVEDALN